MTYGPLDTHRSPIWADLVAMALVGTDRRVPAMPTADGALGDLLGKIAPDNDPSGALLGASAAVALYRRAGWLPPVGVVQSLPPCPPDDLPACSARAGEHLAQMRAGTHAAALPEWLETLAAAGHTVPAAILPALLERGRTEEPLRPKITALLGERGRWLAGLNSDWDYASVSRDASDTEDVTELWETGSRNIRLTLLSQLRACEPDRACDLLAASWASEKVDERADFLATFVQGLRMADEPFLEQALNDRSERVRRVSANLLCRLPESALNTRMIARASQFVRWVADGKPQIELTLPEEYDKSMQRDGIVRKPSSSGIGEKAWWLSQMIELIAPSVWCTLWDVRPVQIIAARMPKEWRDLLLASWTTAAQRHGDQEWLEKLIALRRSGNKLGMLNELLPHLLPARREQMTLELLQTDKLLTGNHPAQAALRSLPGIWSHQLSRAVLDALCTRLMSDDKELRSDWLLRAALDLYATHMPADLADEVGAMISNEMRKVQYWGEAIIQFEELLRFRYEMLRALRDD
ncbi:MAG: DUF5691 domain-containing protein [Chloroflexales bacterium]